MLPQVLPVPKFKFGKTSVYHQPLKVSSYFKSFCLITGIILISPFCYVDHKV